MALEVRGVRGAFAEEGTAAEILSGVCGGREDDCCPGVGGSEAAIMSYVEGERSTKEESSCTFHSVGSVQVRRNRMCMRTYLQWMFTLLAHEVHIA